MAMADSSLHRFARCRGGFTAVELAVVLSVVGLLVWFVSAAFMNTEDVVDRDAAGAHAAEVRYQLRAFARINHRLPCPDVDGDGLESLDEDGLCPGGRQVGFVPYESLDMALPGPGLAAFYGVFRAPSSDAAADADLAILADRIGSGDPDEGPGSADFLRALANAENVGDVDSDRIHLTGDGGAAGAIDCDDNQVRHVAHFLIVPLEDRDSSGSRLDSVHAGSNYPICAYGPATAPAHDRDDVVEIETFAGLAGWLNAN